MTRKGNDKSLIKNLKHNMLQPKPTAKGAAVWNIKLQPYQLATQVCVLAGVPDHV
jgi:hypothetical protein